jgi:hypothetical protein
MAHCGQLAESILDRDHGTELVFTQTRFPADESRDQHEGGWPGSFDRLADALVELMQDSRGENTVVRY